ncbi:MAG: hypothetical protein ACK54P_12445, partial [Bacteroidota bacterium]
MAFDEGYQRLMMVGGQTADLSFTGSVSESCVLVGGQWVPLAFGIPWPISLTAMAYDSQRQVMVAKAGSGLGPGVGAGGIFEWNGAWWTQQHALSSLSSTALAYDGARGVTRVFGGSIGPWFFPFSVPGSTWTWNGTLAVQTVTSASPPG